MHQIPTGQTISVSFFHRSFLRLNTPYAHSFNIRPAENDAEGYQGIGGVANEIPDLVTVDAPIF